MVVQQRPKQGFGLGEVKKNKRKPKKIEVPQKQFANNVVVQKTESPQAENYTDEYKNDLASGESNILVAVRLRPLLKKEVESDCKDIIRVMDKKVVIVLDPGVEADDVLRQNRSREKRYAFDYVFDNVTTQQEVYNSTVSFLLPSVLNGFNATVFAYGATGSGKTFTMLGTEQQPGIMFLTLNDLFEKVAAHNADNKVCTVTLSYIEVYNEAIRDLLNPTSEYLELREDLKGIKIVGVTEIQATGANQVMNLLRKGNKNRSQEPTTMNEESSRSHAVLQVVIEQKDKTPNTKEMIKIGKLSLIDLAGSERASVSNNRGQRLLEGANINRSLLALGNCINALGEKGNKGAYVPYRDSKLTRLLKDSLGGNCRTVMIANVGPAHFCVEDTTNTLKYANRAKNIKTTFTRNVLNVDHHIEKYTKIISALRSEVVELTEKLDVVTRQERSNAKLDSDNQSSNQDFERLRKEVISNFDERIQLRRQLLELEQLESQNRIDCNKIQVEISRFTTTATVNVEGGEPSTPRTVKQARREMTTIVQNMKKNVKLKASLESQLAEYEESGHYLRSELQELAYSKEKKFILELLYRIHVIELENMELSASVQSQSSTSDEKDLQIQKLRLQLQVRDKIIHDQRSLLTKNGITFEPNNPHNLLQFDSSINFKNIDVSAKSPSKSTLTANATKIMWQLKNVNTSHSSPHTPHPPPLNPYTQPITSPPRSKNNPPVVAGGSADKVLQMSSQLQMLKNKRNNAEVTGSIIQPKKTVLSNSADAVDIQRRSALEELSQNGLPAVVNKVNPVALEVRAPPQQRFPALSLLKGRGVKQDAQPSTQASKSDEEGENSVPPPKKINNSQHYVPRVSQQDVVSKPTAQFPVARKLNFVPENSPYYDAFKKNLLSKNVQNVNKKKLPPKINQQVQRSYLKPHTDDILIHGNKQKTKSLQSL